LLQVEVGAHAVRKRRLERNVVGAVGAADVGEIEIDVRVWSRLSRVGAKAGAKPGLTALDAGEGGRRPSRRLNGAPRSGTQLGMSRARWPASRRKETSSFTVSIFLSTLLYFIPFVIAVRTRRHKTSTLV
jgi:hypothetical protein